MGQFELVWVHIKPNRPEFKSSQVGIGSGGIESI